MAWIDMWTGAFSSLWGIEAPDPEEMGDYYSTLVEVYADTAFGELKDIINARLDPSTLSELKGHGAGSFKVSKHDPKIMKNPNLLAYRNYVKIRLNGTVIGGFIIQTKKTVIVGAGEEADEVWEVSGEGPRSWTRDASVYPAKGLKNSSAETRYFNFSTEQGSWYNPANWPYATMRWAWNAKNAPKKHAPAEWPDAAGARWIWNSPYDGNDPQGYCYFRHEFTAPGSPGTVTSYALFLAADDAAEVYVDGEQKAIVEQHGWMETTRVELELEAGPHVIGIKAYNYRSDGPGEIITALFTYGDPNAPSPATLVNHSGMANTWRVNAYPAVEPGWTTGDVILTLLNEAKARGVRFANNFTPTFNSLVDSAGQAWAAPVPWSFEIGSTYEDVIEAAEELGCDVFVDPDTLEMHVWNKRGADRSLQGLLKGPLVEVRRNYIRTTNFSSDWTVSLGTSTVSNGALQITMSGTTGNLLLGSTTLGADLVGTPVSASFKVDNIGSVGVTLEPRIWDGSSYSTGPQVTIGPGQTQLVKIENVTKTGSYVQPRIWQVGNVTGAVIRVSEPILEKSPIVGRFFDGNTVQQAGTELASYRWLATPYASMSVQEAPSTYGDVIVFSPGHNLVGADETGQAQIANTMMLRTPEGWSETTAADSKSLELYGRVETQLATDLTSQGASGLVQEIFRQKALPEISATFEIVPVAGMIPFLDFNVGDWVSAPGEIPGLKESRRVMSIAFTEDANTGLPVYALEFDTIFKDRQSELEKWVSRMSNSSAIGGGFTNSSNLPPTVIVKPPGASQGIIPDAPTGLVVSSLGKYLPDGTSSSDYGLTWNPVVTGSGFGTVEISQYEVWGRLASEEEYHLLVIVFDSMAYLPGFNPGDEWVFKVRAITTSGGPGDFSSEVALVAEAPVMLLGKPSKPDLSSAVGIVSVKWNGLLAGNPAPPYVKYVRVQRKLTSGSTWESVGTLANYSFQDLPPAPGTSVDYRFIAVDIYGRDSAPSDSSTITVLGVDLGDLDSQVSDAIDAAQEAATAAEGLANSAQMAASLAQTAATNAQTSVDGMVSWSPSAPVVADGVNKPVDAIWYQTSANGIIGQWRWNGASWTSSPVDSNAIYSLNAAKLQVGTLTGDKVAANTISASKLLITSLTNLVEDGSFEYINGNAWTLAGGTTADTVNPRTGTRALKVTTTASPFVAATQNAPFQVEAGQQYRLEGWARLDSGTVTDSGLILRISYGPSQSSTTTISADIALTPEDTSTTYQLLSGVWTVPTGAKWAKLSIVSRDVAPGRVYRLDDVAVYKMNSGELIVDGAISADKIGANQIIAAHLSAGSIATESLQAGAVTTEKVAADAITANEIAAGSIEADHIVAGAIQVNHISPAVGTSLDISGNVTIRTISDRADGIEGALEGTQEEVNTLTTYYSFGPEGAIIGRDESEFKLHLNNDNIEIRQNGIMVSRWDSGRMYVDSFVGEHVILGNHSIEKYSTGTVVRAI